MPRPSHTHYPPFNFVACSSGYLLTSGHVRITVILHMHSMTTPLKYYMVPVKSVVCLLDHLPLNGMFYPVYCVLCQLSYLWNALWSLSWSGIFRLDSTSYFKSASLGLLIELCHLSLLPITSEKTVFKDVQMKMCWEELIHKNSHHVINMINQ